jgi:hypothetical protein
MVSEKGGCVGEKRDQRGEEERGRGRGEKGGREIEESII